MTWAPRGAFSFGRYRVIVEAPSANVIDEALLGGLATLLVEMKPTHREQVLAMEVLPIHDGEERQAPVVRLRFELD